MGFSVTSYSGRVIGGERSMNSVALGEAGSVWLHPRIFVKSGKGWREGFVLTELGLVTNCPFGCTTDRHNNVVTSRNCNFVANFRSQSG